MVQAIIHSPIHLGTSNMWQKHGLHERLWLTCRRLKKNCGLCTSISISELEDSCETMEFSWEHLCHLHRQNFFLVYAYWDPGYLVSGLFLVDTTKIKTVLTSQAICKLGKV